MSSSDHAPGPVTFECFHITRRLPYAPEEGLKVGKVLEIGTHHNPFFGFYEGAQGFPVRLADNTVISVPAIKFLKSVQSGEFTASDLPSAAVNVAQHYLMLARELLFEEVRLRDRPLLPSRKTCLWGSDSLEQARFWLSKLGGEGRILRLEVTGSRHVADERFLLGDSEPLSETYRKAELYWQGEHSDDPQLETLASGQVTVLEAFD